MVREVEVQRRAALQVAAQCLRRCPPHLRHCRRQWRVNSLLSGSVPGCLRMLQESVTFLASAGALLACTGEAFSSTLGASLTSRVHRMAKVLGNVSSEAQFEPPLLTSSHCGHRTWSQEPTLRVDLECWRRGELVIVVVDIQLVG